MTDRPKDKTSEGPTTTAVYFQDYSLPPTLPPRPPFRPAFHSPLEEVSLQIFRPVRHPDVLLSLGRILTTDKYPGPKTISDPDVKFLPQSLDRPDQTVDSSPLVKGVRS